VTRLQAGCPRNRGFIPGRGKIFISFPKCPDQGSFPGGKATGSEANHWPPSNIDIKNEWSRTSSPRIHLRGLHRNTFTFVPSCAIIFTDPLTSTSIICTEQIVIRLTPWTCIREMPGSNFGLDTSCPNLEFSWFSVLPGTCRGYTSTRSRLYVSKSFGFIIHREPG
jgi:hypothetical protein